jgi:hypothetical protein
MVRIAGELMKRHCRVAATAVVGAAGADAVPEQHVTVAVLARRGAGAEHGDQ